jgi:hypothetical protein
MRSVSDEMNTVIGTTTFDGKLLDPNFRVARDSGAIRQPVMFRAGLLRTGVTQESTSASALILNLSHRTSSNTAGVFGAEVNSD